MEHTQPEQDHPHKQHKAIAKKVYSRPLMIFLFFMLYILQGFLFGLSISTKMILRQRGASLADLVPLTTVAYPFFFKFIFAPLVDVYKFPTIGRRISWIVPTGIITACLYLYYGPRLDEMVSNLDTFNIAIILFSICFFVALQDIAIDGMVCDILNEEDYKAGTLMQTLGQIVGPFLSANIYLLLSSEKVCKDMFGIDYAILK